MQLSLLRFLCVLALAGPVLAQTPDLRDITQGRPIYQNGYIDQPYVVVLADGRWLCVFTTSGGEEGSSGQHPVATVSSDQGRSWSKPVAIEPSSGPPASWVTPYLTPAGRVYAFYDYNGDNVTTLKGQPIRNDMLGWYCYRYSDDAGQTWSKRYRLPLRKTAVDYGNDWKGEVQIMWGIAKPIRVGKRMFFSFTKLGKYMLDQGEGWLFTTDNIDTEKDPDKLRWELLPNGDQGIRNPKFGSVQEEHNLAALSNGDLYCIYRTTQGVLVDSYSRDGGKSWSLPQAAVYANGNQVIKNPRGCPKVFRCSNGKYLLWYHNHGGKTYADRNPGWLSGGIEEDGKIHWSQPEILLYGADTSYHTGRMSYPDLIEQNGQFWLTETQKVTGRVHPLDLSLLNGLWNQAGPRQATATLPIQTGLVLDRSPVKPNETVAMPALNSLKTGGFSVDLWLTLTDLKPDQVILDSRNRAGRGIRISTTERQTLRLELGNGQQSAEWDTDEGLLQPGKRHHVTFIVDGGPDIITLEVDGKLCDGRANRQYGWGRFSDAIDDVRGSTALKLAPALRGQLHSLRLYNRYLRTSEAIANYRAGLEK